MGKIDSIIKFTLKIALLLFLVVGLTYLVACVYGNVKAMDSNPMDIPDQEKAQYKITIFNTGNTLFSDDVEREGNVVTLDCYWELSGTEYKHNKETIPLDESIFGPISIKRR